MIIDTLEKLFEATSGMNSRQRKVFDWLFAHKDKIQGGIIRLPSRSLSEAVGILNYVSLTKALAELQERGLIEVIIEKNGAGGAITIVLKF